MISLITEEEFDTILKSYRFSCRKAKNNYKEMYTKSYQFDLTKTIFELFEHNKSFNIRQTCTNILCKISTRRDRKSSKIIPILTIYKMVEPKIGITIEKSENEAKELLNEVVDLLKEKYEDIISEKRTKQKSIIENVLIKWSDSSIEESDDFKTLAKEREDLNIKIEKVSSKLRELKFKQGTESTFNICTQIINNNYTIPEEKIEELLCTVEYFEKDVVKEVINSNINACKKILKEK